MLSVMELYTRNGASTVTHCPFSYSWVGIRTEPAGPAPLIPNRLLSCAASWLWPQPDSSIACAIVTAAGTPYWRWAAIAPAATCWIKDCWTAVAGACAGCGATWLLPYRWLAPAADPVPLPSSAPGIAVLVRVDGEVRHRVTADRVQDPACVLGHHLHVAGEQDPVPRLRRIPVSERVPALMGLGVLEDGHDTQRLRIGVDAHVGPAVQRPGIGRAARHPALLPGGLRAGLEREAGKGSARFAVVGAIGAGRLPDQRLHLGWRLALRETEIMLRGADDRRPQRAVARRHRPGCLLERQQVRRHARRRRDVRQGRMGEGDPGHRAGRAEAHQRGRLLPALLPGAIHGFTLLPGFDDGQAALMARSA